MMDQDVRRCLDVESVPWEPVPGAAGPVRWRVLRRDRSGAVLSAVVRLGPGCSTDSLPPAEAATVICYLLDGRLRVAGADHGPGTMVALRPPEASCAGDDGATLVMIVRPGRGACPSLAEAAGTPAVHVSDLPLVESVVGGKPTGITRRILWEDEGDVRLLTVPPGFVGAGEGHHPCSEEILCLEGSINADDHLMSSGWFLYNPTGVVHGTHEFSEDGALLLEWHDGPWDLIRAEPA